MKNYQAGRLINQGFYKSFQPSPINRAWQIDNMPLIQLAGQADRELGRLDMYSDYIPNINLFISMHVLKEATNPARSRVRRRTWRRHCWIKRTLLLTKGMTGKTRRAGERGPAR